MSPAAPRGEHEGRAERFCYAGHLRIPRSLFQHHTFPTSRALSCDEFCPSAGADAGAGRCRVCGGGVLRKSSNRRAREDALPRPPLLPAIGTLPEKPAADHCQLGRPPSPPPPPEHPDSSRHRPAGTNASRTRSTRPSSSCSLSGGCRSAATSSQLRRQFPRSPLNPALPLGRCSNMELERVRITTDDEWKQFCEALEHNNFVTALEMEVGCGSIHHLHPHPHPHPSPR